MGAGGRYLLVTIIKQAMKQNTFLPEDTETLELISANYFSLYTIVVIQIHMLGLAGSAVSVTGSLYRRKLESASFTSRFEA